MRNGTARSGRPPVAGVWAKGEPFAAAITIASASNTAALTSVDAPAFGTKIVHQFDGAFDEVCGLIEFFDGLRSVGMGDHEPVAARTAIVTDLVPQPIAVPVEEPDHRWCWPEYNNADARRTSSLCVIQCNRRWCSFARASVRYVNRNSQRPADPHRNS